MESVRVRFLGSDWGAGGLNAATNAHESLMLTLVLIQQVLVHAQLLSVFLQLQVVLLALGMHLKEAKNNRIRAGMISRQKRSFKAEFKD